MIPRTLHQIWLGDREPPIRWMNTWRDAHPSWSYRVWREEDLAALGLQNGEQFGVYLDAGVYDAASDLARVEILYREGGVYVDADAECLRPLDGADFLKTAGFFATQEIPPDGSYFVTNSFMGAVPEHQVVAVYRDMQGIPAQPICPHHRTGTAHCCAWKLTGPKLLERALEDSRTEDTAILAPWTFFTQTITGEPVRGGEPYGDHKWSLTGARSNNFFPDTTPYEAGM